MNANLKVKIKSFVLKQRFSVEALLFNTNSRAIQSIVFDKTGYIKHHL